MLFFLYDIAGAYLLTQKDVFLDRSHITQLLAYILAGKDVNIRIDLPPPVIVKVSWSISQLVGQLAVRLVTQLVRGFFSRSVGFVGRSVTWSVGWLVMMYDVDIYSIGIMLFLTNLFHLTAASKVMDWKTSL